MDLNNKLVLGSGSPRRKQLLREIGFKFRIMVSDADEIPLPGQTPEEICTHVARLKANALIERIDDDEILITADTIVWHNNKLLGKPADRAHAFEMLQSLSGNKHSVYTGIVLKTKGNERTFYVKSNVWFKKLSNTEIAEYIEDYKPYDKAGSYGAQECLPEHFDPTSEEEKDFLLKNNLNELLNNIQSGIKGKRIIMIDRIGGSYFNVMGLPVVELVKELKNFSKG
jgi:septum formation protein